MSEISQAQISVYEASQAEHLMRFRPLRIPVDMQWTPWYGEETRDRLALRMLGLEPLSSLLGPQGASVRFVGLRQAGERIK